MTMLPEIMNNNFPDIETETKEETLSDLLDELGIEREKLFYLILWNDDVNSVEYVVLSLYEICKVKPDDAMRITFEAHTKGKAVVKSGSFDELSTMKKGLNDRFIEATVEDEV